MKRPRVLLFNLSGRMPLHKQNGCTVLSTSVFFFFIKDLLLLLIFPEQRIFRKKRAFMCKFCKVHDVNKICK